MELFGQDCQKTNQQINQQQKFWQQGCKETFRNTVQKQCGQRSFQPIQNLGKNNINIKKNLLYTIRYPKKIMKIERHFSGLQRWLQK